jgi:hypothetical protein
MRRHTIKRHFLIAIVFAAALMALWMLGVIREAPPLISN